MLKFDSRDTRFKQPFGAVKTAEKIQIVFVKISIDINIKILEKLFNPTHNKIGFSVAFTYNINIF